MDIRASLAALCGSDGPSGREDQVVLDRTENAFRPTPAPWWMKGTGTSLAT